MSMLSIHIHDLEAMRTKLLSAVLHESLDADAAAHAAHAVVAAASLKAVAVAIENTGTTFISSSPQALGDLLEDALREMQAGSAQLN